MISVIKSCKFEMFYFTGWASFLPGQIYFVHINLGLHFNQAKEHLTLSHPCTANSLGIKATTQQMFQTWPQLHCVGWGSSCFIYASGIVGVYFLQGCTKAYILCKYHGSPDTQPLMGHADTGRTCKLYTEWACPGIEATVPLYFLQLILCTCFKLFFETVKM